ncbi:MAG: hypothetical protein QOE86_1504 [Solirubrobacteraceae bacterium]|nr:hypothetical protein [Solirubrobacteraceae bacterium]
MRAAVLHAFAEPLELRDVPDPAPGPGELLVRVRATGLCGTDVKITAGSLPGIELPLICGHEVAGEVVEGGHGFAAGDRVAIYTIDHCGACPPCRRGDTDSCRTAVRIGFERDGGLAQLLRARAANLLPLADGISFEEAAVTMDAVLCPWRALTQRAKVQPGDTVLIVGAGGLGLHAVQIARAAGCRVAVIDPLAAHRETALDLGAEIALSPDEVADGLDGWSEDGVDVAFEASGHPAGFRQGADALRPGGLIVSAGYRPGADYALDSIRLAIEQLRVEGTRGGTVEHARGALAAVERGDVKPLIDEVGTLDDANALLDRLRAGDVTGRVVVRMPG